MTTLNSEGMPKAERNKGKPHQPARWGEHPIVATVVGGLILAAIFYGIHSFFASHGSAVPSLAALKRKSQQELPLSRTPVPGQVSPQLGFGDSIGGRMTIAYAATEQPFPRPIFNAYTDVPHGVGDELQFIHVGRPNGTSPALPNQRAMAVDQGAEVGLAIYVENSAAPEPNCGALVGPRVATNARLRVAIWNSSNRRLHVFRAWVSADNTNPRWITDAVAVTTSGPRRFAVVRGWQYQKVPSGPAWKAVPKPEQALAPAGIPLGALGAIGGCWSNKDITLLKFK